MSPSYSLLLMAKTITHPAARSLYDSWACLFFCTFVVTKKVYYSDYIYYLLRKHRLNGKRGTVSTIKLKIDSSLNVKVSASREYITCLAPVFFYVLFVFLSELLLICSIRSVDVVLSLPMAMLPEMKLTMMLLMMMVTCTRHFRIVVCSNLTIKRQPATEAIRYFSLVFSRDCDHVFWMPC